LVDLSLGTILAQMLNFFILVWLLARFAYKPLLAMMTERKERIKNRARQDIAIERDRAMNSLRNEVVSLSVAMAGKVVAKDMNSETNTKLIEDAIRQLDSKTIGL